MSKPYNSHAKIQDKLLWEAMEDVTEYAFENLPLPNGYIYEQWQKIPFDLIIQWHISNGYSEEDYDHLTIPNPSGKIGSIAPDGGLIVAVKKDNGGNIIKWVPMLTSEAKYQASTGGNALERYFKNYNTIYAIFNETKIFPFITFGEGEGMGSSFILNKIRCGMNCHVNKPIDIYQKKGIFIARVEPWTKNEMYNTLIIGMKQSYDYFINNKGYNF